MLFLLRDNKAGCAIGHRGLGCVGAGRGEAGVVPS